MSSIENIGPAAPDEQNPGAVSSTASGVLPEIKTTSRKTKREIVFKEEISVEATE